MNFQEYIAEAKTLTKIPSWPAQWVKGTIQMAEFLLDDDGDVFHAQAYIAQMRKKPNNWLAIVRSPDYGIEDLSYVQADEATAKAGLAKMKGTVKWADMIKALKK